MVNTLIILSKNYLLLEKDFYEENKGRVSKSMFTNGTGKLYETIQKAHSDSESNISIDELATLHTQVYNPALTRAAKDNFYSLLEEWMFVFLGLLIFSSEQLLFVGEEVCEDSARGLLLRPGRAVPSWFGSLFLSFSRDP